MSLDPLIDIADAMNEKAREYGVPFRCDSELKFDRPELNLLRDVWRSNAAKLTLPRRSDFDARTLESALKHLAVMERAGVADEVSRYRVQLMGSYIAAVLGDQTGNFIDEFVPPPLLPRWIKLFDAVIGSGLPLRIVSHFEYAGLNYAAGEMFIAPLSDEAGLPNLVIVCLFIKPRDQTDASNESTSVDGGLTAQEETSLSVRAS